LSVCFDATPHSGLPHLSQALSGVLNPSVDGEHCPTITVSHLRPGARRLATFSP
jgi:hypothetical protein